MLFGRSEQVSQPTQALLRSISLPNSTAPIQPKWAQWPRSKWGWVWSGRTDPQKSTQQLRAAPRLPQDKVKEKSEHLNLSVTL